ncbi:MAG: DUF378 domain-containing protein [Candidatus Ryanbacteria bacterium CG10_big_fil_rev_8_21_14_0_10_43_42]|uniref:DUF378 domain-containing protein n=1 Tax=Candidatus Ryanbacteria bacterium CG10_big_fil_rev_8_21_14_0_10_43_42 TaxID=1974864 RepID=A0A2M8KVW7_9BACT|nr:MAG: DUF378 domain-containing protein [Candidatus Ryanbacteria bacterium CG10_big_fil_rev_8_21_14_0_10_43_42]
MKALHVVTFILLVVGGLNWLLVGLFQWDIGQVLGGMDSMLSRIVYVLVGASAVVVLFTHKKDCRACSMGGSKPSMPPTNPQGSNMGGAGM